MMKFNRIKYFYLIIYFAQILKQNNKIKLKFYIRKLNNFNIIVEKIIEVNKILYKLMLKSLIVNKNLIKNERIIMI